MSRRTTALALSDVPPAHRDGALRPRSCEDGPSLTSGRSGHRPSWLSWWADDGLFTFGSFSTLAPPLSHALPGCAALRGARELGHSVTLNCVLQKHFRRMHMEAPLYDSVPNQRAPGKPVPFTQK